MNVSIDDRKFNKTFRPLLDNHDPVNIFFGGSSSGKSHFIAQRYIVRMLENPRQNVLCCRKIGENNRDSTFQELNKVISDWGLESVFKSTINPLRIQRIGGGVILFRGLDKVEKIKSVTFQKGVLNDIWAEEATEMTQDDILELQLRMRGKSDIPKQMTLSFNPISALHWIKKLYFDQVQTDCTIHHSTYLDNEHLEEREKKVLQDLKKKDEIKYDIYALGKWGVLGNIIYSNYEVHEFDDDFDTHDNGLDWGYNHPAAGLKMGFRDDEIYIIKEFYASECKTPDLMRLAKRIWNKNTDRIVADSAEPKSIAEWQAAGWMIEGARKGKDSVRNGIGWIRGHKIHIHPRCQNFINEIQGYCYKKTRDGQLTEEPVDYLDHLMDAKRYGLEHRMERRQRNYARQIED